MVHRFMDTTPAGTVFGAETVDPGAAKGKSRSRGKKKKPEGGDANAEAEDEAAPVAVEAAPAAEAAAQGASDVEKKIKALRKWLGSICVLEPNSFAHSSPHGAIPKAGPTRTGR